MRVTLEKSNLTEVFETSRTFRIIQSRARSSREAFEMAQLPHIDPSTAMAYLNQASTGLHNHMDEKDKNLRLFGKGPMDINDGCLEVFGVPYRRYLEVKDELRRKAGCPLYSP